MDLALNNLLRLICHKTQQTKPNQLKKLKGIGVRADRWKNIYELNPSNYHKILRNKITDTFKIDQNDTISQINDDALKFANKLRIEGRFKMKDAYLLFKDHKNNFENKSSLINPLKNKVRDNLKNIIQNIVLNIQKTIHNDP